MYIIEERKDGLYALPAGEIDGFNYSPLAERILFLLAKKPGYPREIASKLNVHEQKVYYHIRNLEKAGVIKVVRKEERGGAITKFYALTKPSFFMRFKELEPMKRIPRSSGWLEPFVVDGKLNAKIVVGSPDPHGPERARSRDAYYAIDLGLFIGSFLTDTRPSVNLDVEMHGEDMKENLIVIGGPVINRVTKVLNDRLPVKFDARKNIFSTLSKRTYRRDECGIIVKAANPFSKDKKILVIAGKRYSGTRAAIIALLKRFDEISKGHRADARIVEGLDMDGDGIVDDAKILE